MNGRTDIEQAIVNHMKIARDAIRLKHSIAADTELNTVLPALRTRLEAQAQHGILPALTVPELLDIGTIMEDAASAINGD